MVDDSSLKQRALALWQEAQRYHLHGEVDRAIDLYSQSIGLFPTAEAYTFRGWAYGARKRYDEAIAECKKAIAVDPTFGNPYNDIGSYLYTMGKLDEAIDWLEKAKIAPRYEPRHFPFMNLGRVYAAKGMVLYAIREFEGALEIQPAEPTCLAVLEDLRRALN